MIYFKIKVAQLLFKSPLFIVFILSSTVTFAQNTQVQFEANMNYMIERNLFDPATETVDIAGSFNNWGGNYTQMLDHDGDGIYSVSVSLQVGQAIEFKGRINGEWNGREEFPGGGSNRQYVVVADGSVQFWYNDEVPDDVLSVHISASKTFVEPGETVQFFDASNGFPVSWNWSFEGALPATSTEQNPIVLYSEEGSYDVSLTIENEAGESISRTYTNFISVGNKTTNWWNEEVFYEIFVRSFKDSDGDGKGDLRGLINQLDYLNDGNPATHEDLGIGGIWLMPISESPSYHGYDVTDYRSVATDYGTNEDFKELMEEAHKRGIKIIVDYVMNHSSSQHPWFQSSRSAGSDKRDWYIWRNSHPGYTGPWGQNVWHSSNNAFYYGVFWSGMPDLNYENAAVKEEMFDVAKYWIEEMNVDGFRLDAVKFIFIDGNQLEDTDATIQFWKDFRQFYKSIDQEVFAVGEAWTSTGTAQRYVNDGGLDYVFEFDLAGAMLNAANNGNVSGLYNQMDQVMAAYPYLQFGTFLTNHDINRVMDILGRDVQKAKFGADLLLTLPGIPYIYYGEEIGMTGSKPDENIRTPMQWNDQSQAGFSSGNPWRAVNSDFTQKNVQQQQRDHQSLWHHYRKLIAIRNSEAALRKGDYSSISNNQNAVYSFLRYVDDEYILVVSNASESTVTNVQISQANSAIPSANYTMVNLLTGEQISVDVDENGGLNNVTIVELEAKSSAIFKFMDPSAISKEVHFSIDMNSMIAAGQFDPDSDKVDMVSNFNELGEGELLELTNENENGIYSMSLPDVDLGTTIHYKYRINGQFDGTEEFADSDFLRAYRVKSGDNQVLNVYEKYTILAIEEPLKNRVSVYPNPSKSHFYIELKGSGHASYQVIDLQGKKMLQGQLMGNIQEQVDTENWPSGLYLVVVQQEDQWGVFRVIVR